MFSTPYLEIPGIWCYAINFKVYQAWHLKKEIEKPRQI